MAKNMVMLEAELKDLKVLQIKVKPQEKQIQF